MAIRLKDKRSFKRDFDRLVTMSRSLYDSDKKLSDRYAYIAYRIYVSKKINLDKNEKVLICKRCYKILIPGKSTIVRVRKGLIIYKCLNCGTVRKLGYDKGSRR